MTQIILVEPACRRVLASLDSYIDNELATETNLDLVEHLRQCAPCTREAGERREMRARLRTAVHEAGVPPGLEERVRDRLRQSQQTHAKKIYLMAIAAMLAVSFGSWLTFRSVIHGPSAVSQPSFIAEFPGQVAAVMRVGLQQHLHCAVIRQRNNRPSQPVNKLSAPLQELLPIVRQHVPANLPLSVAHECSFEGRKFVHLTFRAGRGLLSLVIARSGEGESFQASNLLPALTQSGIPMYAESAAPYQVAAFESSGFVVYTISELPPHKNLEVLTALAPALHAFLERIGS